MTSPHGTHPSGTTAILAGILGLALTGVLGYLPVTVFITDGISGLPAPALEMLGLYLGAALLLLLGAVVTFLGALTGAVLLLAGGLAAVGAVLSEPLLFYPSQIGEFFQAMFSLTADDAFVRVGAAVGGPLVFLLSALPATFRYLRYQPAAYTRSRPREY